MRQPKVRDSFIWKTRDSLQRMSPSRLLQSSERYAVSHVTGSNPTFVTVQYRPSIEACSVYESHMSALVWCADWGRAVR